MKKLPNYLWSPIPRFKFDLKMKLSALFIFATLFMLQANSSYSQKTKISLDLNNVTIERLIDEIENKTEFRFVYMLNDVDIKRLVSVKANKEKVTDILDRVFGNGITGFRVIDRQIYLTKKKTPPIPKEEAAISQDPIRVSGKVSDETGAPLPGVAVRISGTNTGVATNFDGDYTLIVPSSTTVLVFTSIGFATKEIIVGDQTALNVTMQEDVSELDEVVLNAGYYNVPERTKTGSIAKVEAKTIAQQPVPNPLAALPGRIPGVQITQQSGVPGAGFTVRIRGQNSINSGNEPFYVIDGIPYDSRTMSTANVSGSILPQANLSPFSLINPSDIESVEVLKDADATAIYGSRGANGVILITTKKGREGKTSFNVNVNTGLANVANTLDLLNTEQYLEIRREAFANDGVTDITTQPSFRTNDLLVWDQNRSTDWQKELIGGTAYTHNIQASVSGGSSTTQFLVGGGYLTETSILPGDFKYKRGSVNSKINHSSSDGRFKLAFSTNLATETNDLPSTDLASNAYSLPPNAPALRDDEGKLNFENGTFQNNPLAALEREYGSERFNLLANMGISYQIIPGLEIKANLGQSYTDLEDYATIPSTSFDPAFGFGPESSFITVNSSKRHSWIIEPQINWEHPIGKGILRVLAGTTFQQQTDEQLVQSGFGFTSNSLIRNLSAASQQFITNDDKTEYKYNAVFGRVNYNWQGRYILNLTGRRDGSSRFGPGKQFANFGAVGAAWLFSNENFLKDNSFLSFGKLRGSYGTSGNDQIGDYQFLDTYRITGNPYNGIIGLESSRLFNPDFSWETNKKLEIALELGMFKDRISITGSYYRNISTNQLVGTPLPTVTGFSSIQSNLEAKVKNTGMELEISTVNFQTDSFRWTSSFNATIPRNELVAFPGLEESTFANQFVVGESLGIQKLFNSLGVNPETGLYEFEDFNDDGVISAPDDRQFIEDLAPTYFGGLNNTLSFKNLDLDFFFQFSKQKARNLAASIRPGLTTNFPVELLDRWQQPGDQATYQRYTAGIDSDVRNAFFSFRDSNAAISDASFIRLKNISLSYTIPATKLRGIQCRLYVQGQNLFTIANFQGVDPEQPFGANIPILRRLNLGAAFNF
ncbi:MAG: TonB-dependent receptor [Saonia sp.]